MANPENLREQTEKMKNGLAAEIGAKGGANKKGSRHLTTLIREIGYNFDWSKTTLKNKDELVKKYGKTSGKLWFMCRRLRLLLVIHRRLSGWLKMATASRLTWI